MTTLRNDPVLAAIAIFWACIVLAAIYAGFSLARDRWRAYLTPAPDTTPRPWFGHTDAELMALLRETATVPQQRRSRDV